MAKKKAFDTKQYLKIQKENILKRISEFGSKLYLEFGGKLFDDYHASRVLPGFEPDAKLQLLLSLKDNAEVIIVVNARDINTNKVRGDTGLSYQAEVERLVEIYNSCGLLVNSVVISMFEDTSSTREFMAKLANEGIKTYKHYKIAGYPQNIPLILSDEGLGKNEFVETTKPLVVVTAPGPGSGKLATCLSQVYNSEMRGIKAGYAKYETFPIWSIPLKHPVNLAYEAATLDLDDVNMIDPYHLEKYGKLAVNYNRDVEAFPLLKSIFTKIYGSTPYYSPTDMGVNMAGFAIVNDEAACQASKDEIIRRYYGALKSRYLGKYNDKAVAKAEFLMNQVGATPDDRKCVKACLDAQAKKGTHTVAIQLNSGKIVVGKKSDVLTASASALINALKALAKIDDSFDLISPNVVNSVKEVKRNLISSSKRMNDSEVLIALAIQSNNNPLAAAALKQIPKLKGAQAHASCILTDTELGILKKVGIDVTEQAASYIKAHHLTK